MGLLCLLLADRLTWRTLNYLTATGRNKLTAIIEVHIEPMYHADVFGPKYNLR